MTDDIQPCHDDAVGDVRFARGQFIRDLRARNAAALAALTEDMIARAARLDFSSAIDSAPRPEPEEAPRRRGLDIDIDARIGAAIMHERERVAAIVAGVVAEERTRQRDVLAHLVAEIRREGKAAIESMREIAAEREQQAAEIAAEREQQFADLLGEVHALRVQCADLRGEIERLRRPIVSEGGKADLRAVN